MLKFSSHDPKPVLTRQIDDIEATAFLTNDAGFYYIAIRQNGKTTYYPVAADSPSRAITEAVRFHQRQGGK